MSPYESTRAREGSRRVSRASIFKRFRYVVPPLVALRCNAGRGHEGRRLRGHSAIDFHCLRALQGHNCTQRVFVDLLRASYGYVLVLLPFLVRVPAPDLGQRELSILQRLRRYPKSASPVPTGPFRDQ